MNLDKLKKILDKITANPKIKKALDDIDLKNDKNNHVDMILKVLGAATFLTFFPGRIGRKIEGIAIIIAVLIKLSILVKEHVIEDPKVQAMVRDAWEELSDQSAALYVLAKNLAKKLRPKSFT
jgi:hypothetical protein